MANSKYISTKEAVRLTGLSTQEVYDLIHSGTLPAHKAPKSGWRIALQDLKAQGLIREETERGIEETSMERGVEDMGTADGTVDAPMAEGVAYVADEEHYSVVFKRMTEARRSLKVATANLKNFNVVVESDGGGEEMRLYNTGTVLLLACSDNKRTVPVLCARETMIFQEKGDRVTERPVTLKLKIHH